MTLFCAVVLFAGEDLMRLLYHGEQYEGHGHTVTVLALAMLASAVGMPASNGLATIERPDAVFRTALFAVVLSVVLIWFMVTEWGLVGAPYGFLAGNLTASVGRWVAFLTLVPRRGMATRSTTSAYAMQQEAGSRSQGGPWRMVLRRMASRRILAMFHGPRPDEGAANTGDFPAQSQLTAAEVRTKDQ
jgi:hypothetical protein